MNPPPPLAVRLAPLRRQLDADLARIAHIPAIQRRQATIDALCADLDGVLDQEERCAVVCLVGSTGAGKSTLINALAGQPIARAGDSRPTTTIPTAYVPEDADLSRLDALAGPDGLSVVRYTPHHSAPWSGQIFIDAPDVNSVAAVHRERVAAMVAGSDVLLVVMHRQSITERSPVAFIDDWHDRRHLIFVLNRSDELLDKAREALVAQIAQLAAVRWKLPSAPVLAVSALQGQRGRDQGGLGPLVALLQGLAEQATLQQVRRHSALGVVARISAEAAAAYAELATDLSALPGELADGLEAVRKRIEEDGARRLTVRQVDITAQLADEVGRRWAGPGGLLIRAGGLTGLGAAAGALVTRRTLVGGAAVAGVSALADQGARQLRQWRVEAGTEMLPTPGDVRAWSEQALVGPQTRALRIGLPTPEALQAPHVRDRSLDALADAWRGIIHRDLPEAASRAGHPVLRWGLDLPIWAAAAWIVYRVADGYVAGDHEGVAFLVDTAILVAAYAIIERTIVMAWLRLQARALTTQIQETLRTRLAEAHHPLVRDTRAVMDAQATALQTVAETIVRWRSALQRTGAPADEAK